MSSFIEAKNKSEVVARISALTNSGPETLGPGSKERKSVVSNLAKGLGIPFTETDTKQSIARKIAVSLGKNWTEDCESTGQTLTLKGLNLILQAAQEHLKSLDGRSSIKNLSVDEEINAIKVVLKEVTPKNMVGEAAIIEMKEAEYKKWRQTEWQGFYFEFKVLPPLINTYGGGPKKIGRTEFDYHLERIWDLKVHSMNRRTDTGCILNDAQAIDNAVSEYGFGMIVLNGEPQLDLEFTRWHKKFRGEPEGEPTRLLKKEFHPKRIDIFYIPDIDRLAKAKFDRELVDFHQGRQATGHSRNIKYSLNLKKALESDLYKTSIQIN